MGDVCVLQEAEIQFVIKTELQNTKEKATGYEKGGTEMKTSCSMNSNFTVLQKCTELYQLAYHQNWE